MQITGEDIDAIVDSLEASKTDLNYDRLDKVIVYLNWWKTVLTPKPPIKVKRIKSKRIRRCAYAQSARKDIRREPR
jgi:hypothetical protein